MIADALYLPGSWSLDPAVVHLNHGSFGAPPVPVLAEQERWRARMEANPVDFFRNVVQSALDTARAAMDSFLGSDPDGVAFVQNATSGAWTVLAGFPLAAGDEILLTDHAYGTTLVGARKAAARAGASVVEVPIALDADADAVLAALLGAVTARTRLAVVDQIASPTAKLFPAARIAAALRERGVATLVDGAHVPGQLAVDVTALGADFWTGNFHKWAGTPRGTAGLYVAPRWRAQVDAYPVSWREAEGFPHAFNQPGTADSTAWLSLPAALDFFGALGWDAVRARNAALVEYGQREVARAVGADLAGLPPDEGLAMRLIPLAAVRGGLEQVDALRNRLATQEGIETSITWWGERAFLRLSAQLYNCEGDYERVAAALKKLLA